MVISRRHSGQSLLGKTINREYDFRSICNRSHLLPRPLFILTMAKSVRAPTVVLNMLDITERTAL